jgi:putative inorganic carbon (HCO3(-)) transporter
MHSVSQIPRAQQWIVMVLLVATASGVIRSAFEPFNIVKATLIVLAAVAVVALGALRAAAERRLAVPMSPVLVPLGIFLFALVVAAVTADNTGIAVVGVDGRWSGLALYAALATLFVAILRIYDAGALPGLARAVVVATVPVVLYGLVQWAGLDPINWELRQREAVFSTLGNANFLAAFLAITVPVGIAGALSTSWRREWRVLSGTMVLAALLLLIATRSLQGPAAAAAGIVITLLAWVRTKDGRARRYGLLLISAAVGLGLLLGVGILAGVGPLASVQATELGTVRQRLYFWDAAVAMVADRPLAGFGLGGYEQAFAAHRPAAHAVAYTFGFTDSPHNVPLRMFAEGGVLLGLSYVGFIGLVGVVLVNGLRRLQGDQLLLLGGLAGGWTAYQVQSLVSIEVPPLALLHWILAGGIVVLAARPRLRTLWPRPAAAPTRSTRSTRKGARSIPLVPRWVPAAVAVVALLLAWPLTRPLRADLAAGSARAAAARGDVSATHAGFGRARHLASWEPVYPFTQGQVLEEAGTLPAALVAYSEAASLQPGYPPYALAAARVAAALNDDEALARWSRQLVEIDPRNPEVLVEAAQAVARSGDPERAVELARRAVELEEDRASWWVALGQTREAAGDLDGARSAYEQALTLEPGNSEADSRLEALG